MRRCGIEVLIKRICTNNFTHTVYGGGAGDRERQERHESKAGYRYEYVYEAKHVWS